jgi:hypothetical protein
MTIWKFKSSTNKYKNEPCVRDGMKLHSKAEGKYYDELTLLKKEGTVSFFLRQCPIHLTAGVKYIVDFIVFYSNGTIEFIDVKGTKTQTYLLKKKQVEHMYPIEIKEIFVKNDK